MDDPCKCARCFFSLIDIEVETFWMIYAMFSVSDLKPWTDEVRANVLSWCPKENIWSMIDVRNCTYLNRQRPSGLCLSCSITLYHMLSSVLYIWPIFSFINEAYYMQLIFKHIAAEVKLRFGHSSHEVCVIAKPNSSSVGFWDCWNQFVTQHSGIEIGHSYHKFGIVIIW